MDAGEAQWPDGDAHAEGVDRGLLADRPAKYADGVTLAVTKVGAATEPTIQGPGMFPGRKLVIIDLALTNGSGQRLDLNSVVVTLAYGKPAKIAQPTYNTTGLSDFNGTVAAGKRTTARYAFAVPESQRSSLTAVVDLSSSRYPAVLTGSAP